MGYLRLGVPARPVDAIQVTRTTAVEPPAALVVGSTVPNVEVVITVLCAERHLVMQAE